MEGANSAQKPQPESNKETYKGEYEMEWDDLQSSIFPKC